MKKLFAIIRLLRSKRWFLYSSNETHFKFTVSEDFQYRDGVELRDGMVKAIDDYDAEEFLDQVKKMVK